MAAIRYAGTIVCIILIFSIHSFAKSNYQYDIDYKDSVILAEGSHILSNNIIISNTFRTNISIGIRIKFPTGWKSIGKLNQNELASFFLKPNEKKIIPLSLLYTSKVKAGWDSICIIAWNAYKTSTKTYIIRIQTKENPNFIVQTINGDQNYSQVNPEQLYFKFLIKNTGNTPDIYKITSFNANFSWQYTSRVNLEPGQDTVLNLILSIKKQKWKLINQERIPFVVVSEKLNNSKAANFSIKRVSSKRIATAPAQRGIPFTIGGGMMMNGSDIRYFGQASTEIRLGSHYFGFSYRTQDFGTTANTYQPNAFNFNYAYKGFQLTAGQIDGPKNFYTFGQGLRIQYIKNKTKFSMSAIRHNTEGSYYNKALLNDNILAALSYSIGKKAFNHIFESNFNSYYVINSYLTHHEVDILNNKSSHLKIYGGWGWEQKLRDNDSVEKRTQGWAIGYELNTKRRAWQLYSTLRYRSSSYPGIYQGMKYQYHELSYKFSKFYINSSFYLNSVEKNTLKDTLYNTDYLSTNNIKCGVGIGYDYKSVKSWIGIGKLLQAGRLYNYSDAIYIDYNFNLAKLNSLSIRLNLKNALIPVESGSTTLSTNTQVQAGYKCFSINGSYNRSPRSGDGSNSSYETVNGGPCLTASFFDNSLFCSLQYSIAKTLSEEVIRHGLGGQLSFRDAQHGITVGINASYPLKDPQRIDLPISETRTASLYLLKRINIHLEKPKTTGMKVTLFKDLNNNNAIDEGEPPLSGVFMNINGDGFITDEQGEAIYKNLKKGATTLSFINTKMDNLVPTEGVIRTIDLQKEENIFIPFREGRRLKGNIRVINDSLSKNAITPDNFKIIIEDSSGIVHFALSDIHGDFYIYLPEGKYKVSLNADVFKGSDYIPEKMSCEVNLIQKQDADVQFVIAQKKRKIRFLNNK